MITEIAESTIRKYNMTNRSESLLCCLSGGADSTALLLCLHELGYSVEACHINHCLRGEESDRDQRFCEELCERLGIKLTVRRLDVKGYCAEKGVSIEEGARTLRYGVFEELGCDKIATAHTLNDCIETAVFNLARGTGLTGLASIPPVRGKIIRPLIEVSRAEIEDYLRSRGQEWVTDSTNLTDEHTRNRIRHYIFPELTRINPSLEKTMRGTLENLREDSGLIKRLAEEFYGSAARDGGLDCEALLGAERALTGRAVRRLVTESGIECSRETALRILTLCADGKGKLTLGHGRYAEVKKGLLRITRDRLPCPAAELRAVIGEENLFLGKRVSLKISDNSGEVANIHENLTKNAADYGKIKGDIVIRNRRAGDRIKLRGRGFTSEVKKLLQSRFSTDERGRAVILADSEGVIFVEGFGFAERVAADGTSKTLLFCKIS